MDTFSPNEPLLLMGISFSVFVSKGEIVKEVNHKGFRKTYFPKKTENRISHVRPHARNKDDTYDLPIADKLTGLSKYTKHCFWLNAAYVKNEIYEK